MPICKCGRALKQYKMNIDTYGQQADGRAYYCPRCKLPAKECTCEEWQFAWFFGRKPKPKYSILES